MEVLAYPAGSPGTGVCFSVSRLAMAHSRCSSQTSLNSSKRVSPCMCELVNSLANDTLGPNKSHGNPNGDTSSRLDENCTIPLKGYGSMEGKNLWLILHHFKSFSYLLLRNQRDGTCFPCLVYKETDVQKSQVVLSRSSTEAGFERTQHFKVSVLSYPSAFWWMADAPVLSSSIQLTFQCSQFFVSIQISIWFQLPFAWSTSFNIFVLPVCWWWNLSAFECLETSLFWLHF